MKRVVEFRRPVQMFNVAAPRLRTASPAEADRSLLRGTCPLGSEDRLLENRRSLP